MKNIQAVIFDVDGQLIYPHEYFSEKYIQEFGGNAQVIRKFFKEKWNDVVTGRLDLKEELDKIIDEWQIPDSVEGYLVKWFEYESRVDDRIVAIIKELKKIGIVCVLATNNEKYRVHYLSKNLGFSDLFDEIYASGFLDSKKPEEKFFEQIYSDISHQYEFSKDEILFCDDKKENIQGATDFGFSVHHYVDIREFEDLVQEICKNKVLSSKE